METLRVPHEYLRAEDYYESNQVKSGRKVKTCAHCNKEIPIGTAHDVHKFYPDYNSYSTHKECTDVFKLSLRTSEEGYGD